jgi:hypothetical protein
MRGGFSPDATLQIFGDPIIIAFFVGQDLFELYDDCGELPAPFPS